MSPDELKLLRLSAKLSVTEAARSVCVSDRTWQRYESGDRKIPDGVVELFKIKHDLK